MASAVVRPPVVKVQALICPNCGGTVELKGFAHTLTVVCAHCLSVLDASTPTLRLLQKIQEAQRRTPSIPLGTRGKFQETLLEFIGFQVRGFESDGTLYEWNEYVLFNPYKGFRYVTEYEGHWNFVTTVKALPVETSAGVKPAMRLQNRTYPHFQRCQAGTIFVMGEFPWRVKVGEVVEVNDFISPPYLLSGETTSDEIVWSRGEYMTGRQVWQCCQLKDSPPPARGIFENQPSPYQGRTSGLWQLSVLMLIALFVVASYFLAFSRNEVVFDQHYSFSSGAAGEPSFVTPVFDLQGHVSNVRLQIGTNLDNNWAYFNFALINEATGQGYDFGREVSYYYGTDSDGSWTEGSKDDSVAIPSVPPGRYYLRVEPEMDKSSRALYYELEVRRDTPSYSYYLLALLLLLIPPAVVAYRSFSFERTRWRESDYSIPASTSSGGDDD